MGKFITMVTGEQIRAALGALRWSRRILCERSGVPERTVQRMAEAEGVPNTNAKHLEAVQLAFEEGTEKGYIEFTNSAAPGVRFHRRP